MTPRPLEASASLADKANEQCGQAHYSLAGNDVGRLLAQSHASAFTVPPAERDQVFTAAVTSCFAAGVVSSRVGNIDLTTTAAHPQRPTGPRTGGDLGPPGPTSGVGAGIAA
ncbi:MAG: hypothetical protein ACRDRO_20885 [Pseudonocardiaceae bacterium]